MSIGYNKPKNYSLTPSRKHLGKCVARGSRVGIATACLKDDTIRKHIISKLGNEIRLEISYLCSNKAGSTLMKHSKDDLSKFTWADLLKEIEQRAPTFFQFLMYATSTRVRRPNREAVMGMCAAMMFKLRRPNMTAAHKIVSLILHAGHAAKRVCV